jgi:hypothetical protein
VTISELIKKIEVVKKSLSNVTSNQLHSAKLRDEIRVLIEAYFKIVRPQITTNSSQDSEIGKVDGYFQTLLELCHKKGKVTTYTKSLTTIRSQLIKIDSKQVSFNNPVSTTGQNSVDLIIIDTLQKILPSAALSFKQAVDDLTQDSRYSWRGPATDLREALRETLDHLAPDKDVTSMPGYTQAKDVHGPTMKQKVRFILSKRGISKTNSETAENATESVDGIIGAFVRSVYTRSSISTHTSTDKSEVLRIRNFVRVVFCELLEIQV